MAIEMKSISNYDYLRYMTAASREISDEPLNIGHNSLPETSLKILVKKIKIIA
jgi:hypothetical protein